MPKRKNSSKTCSSVKRKKENFLAGNYKKCFSFMEEIKWYFVFSVGLFSLFFLIGFIFPIFFREQIISIIADLSTMLDGKSVIGTIIFIFLNNVQSGFISFVLGIGLAVFPLMTLIFNGYLLGFVGREVAAREGILVLWRILPHGIFELPAIFLSTSIGIKIGVDFFLNKKSLKYNYREGLRFFVFVVVPLLIIAAAIEGLLISLL